MQILRCKTVVHLIKTIGVFICNAYYVIFPSQFLNIYRALDVRLSEWCCSVSMVWVQIPSREEQKFDSSKI
jgi:hypothetical protein